MQQILLRFGGLRSDASELHRRFAFFMISSGMMKVKSLGRWWFYGGPTQNVVALLMPFREALSGTVGSG